MRIILILILLFPILTVAATLTGRVVRVIDGDTLVVLDANKAQHEIRLAGIDSPEQKQAYGMKAKEYLGDLVAGRFIVIDYNKHDRDKRIIGKVLLSNQDMNLEQIKAGLAWYDKKHAIEQTESDRELYAQIEDEARQAKRGLWLDANPIPPWEFRRK